MSFMPCALISWRMAKALPALRSSAWEALTIRLGAPGPRGLTVTFCRYHDRRCFIIWNGIWRRQPLPCPARPFDIGAWIAALTNQGEPALVARLHRVFNASLIWSRNTG
jgi:hypothetical protein